MVQGKGGRVLNSGVEREGVWERCFLFYFFLVKPYFLWTVDGWRPWDSNKTNSDSNRFERTGAGEVCLFPEMQIRERCNLHMGGYKTIYICKSIFFASLSVNSYLSSEINVSTRTHTHTQKRAHSCRSSKVFHGTRPSR